MKINIKEIINKIPKDLKSNEEILRYIYLELGNIFSYNRDYFYVSDSRFTKDIYEEENYNADSINIDQGYFSVFELKRKYDRTKLQRNIENKISNEDRRNQIILDSDFQREAVWKIKQKSELIESVLMGLPIPIMYLYEDKFANLVVVDGRQRLTAFFEFLDEKYELTGL